MSLPTYAWPVIRRQLEDYSNLFRIMSPFNFTGRSHGIKPCGAKREEKYPGSIKSANHSLMFMSQEHDLERDLFAMNEVSQNARSELKVYEELFDWMRIRKRQITLLNHRY